MKQKAVNVISLLCLVAGVGLLLYPVMADWWNQIHQSYAIAAYVKSIAEEEVDYHAMKQEAVEYNQELIKKENRWHWSGAEKRHYHRLLSITEQVTGNGILGCLRIPKIDVFLPIYHGTEETVLQTGIGHMQGTSLPVAGETTHCVLSGHTGLPSSKLFTDLDQMEEGDIFTIRVLDEVMTYKVERILVVKPQEMEYLAFEEGREYCTLLTCTPYGINTHRLLVRGHRVENQEKQVEQLEEVWKNRLWQMALATVFPMTVIVMFLFRKYNLLPNPSYYAKLYK